MIYYLLLKTFSVGTDKFLPNEHFIPQIYLSPRKALYNLFYNLPLIETSIKWEKAEHFHSVFSFLMALYSIKTIFTLLSFSKTWLLNEKKMKMNVASNSLHRRLILIEQKAFSLQER